MKRLSAIALSLLLLWVQVFALAWPATAAAPTACRCCDCDAMDCCVSETSSTPSPLAATPVQAIQPGFNLFTLPVSPAWRLPRGEAEVFASISTASLDAARVPLFARHCARLI